MILLLKLHAWKDPIISMIHIAVKYHGETNLQTCDGIEGKCTIAQTGQIYCIDHNQHLPKKKFNMEYCRHMFQKQLLERQPRLHGKFQQFLKDHLMINIACYEVLSIELTTAFASRNTNWLHQITMTMEVQGVTWDFHIFESKSLHRWSSHTWPKWSAFATQDFRCVKGVINGHFTYN